MKSLSFGTLPIFESRIIQSSETLFYIKVEADDVVNSNIASAGNIFGVKLKFEFDWLREI